ncbi:MAG: GCN5-related N-acetyltransferase [Deinococcus sp.]|nr:GCN5-related N-acetyltransferase [Deinococcus sp.]
MVQGTPEASAPLLWPTLRRVSDPPLIRPIQPSDEGVVGQIAYQTGFFGHSAARYFANERLFARLWVGPYFGGGGFACLVAESRGEVLGYILGSPDPALYGRALRRVLLRRTLAQVLPLRQTWASLPYLLRAGRYPSPHPDWKQFPAHLHINLLPAARGLGLGKRLLAAHLEALAGAGVGGVQLSTTTENRAALELYRQFDFVPLARGSTPLWTPWLGHPAEHVGLGLRLSRRPEDR